MLITPAMASEPYWAAAPSRSTSIRLTAGEEICDRSGPCEPTFRASPVTCTSAERCMRLPLISTRIWSAGRPRRFGGRTKAEASPKRLRFWLNDGTSVFRMLCSCGDGWALKSSALNTSIGTALSATVRSVRRVPVTMIVVSSFEPSAAAASWSSAAARAGAAMLASTRATIEVASFRSTLWALSFNRIMSVPWL